MNFGRFRSYIADTLKSFGNVWQKLLICDNNELNITDNIRDSTMNSLDAFQKIVRKGKANCYLDYIPKEMDDFDFVYKESLCY